MEGPGTAAELDSRQQGEERDAVDKSVELDKEWATVAEEDNQQLRTVVSVVAGAGIEA